MEFANELSLSLEMRNIRPNYLIDQLIPMLQRLSSTEGILLEFHGSHW
jgi:hypothetical protein